MDKILNTGRRTYFTEEEHNAYRLFVSDNNGIKSASEKLGMQWHTVMKHIDKGYCAPSVYPVLKRKIFKHIKTAA